MRNMTLSFRISILSKPEIQNNIDNSSCTDFIKDELTNDVLRLAGCKMKLKDIYAQVNLKILGLYSQTQKQFRPDITTHTTSLVKCLISSHYFHELEILEREVRQVNSKS